MLPPKEFDGIVENALRLIPARFRRRMQNVAIVVEEEPPRPGLLGLYQGRPLANRSVFESFTLPDKITIYQGPHERMARSRAELEQTVADNGLGMRSRITSSGWTSVRGGRSVHAAEEAGRVSFYRGGRNFSRQPGTRFRRLPSVRRLTAQT